MMIRVKKMKVKIFYKKIKLLHLRVVNKEVIISAPLHTSKAYIENFVLQNKEFIEKQILKQQKKDEKRTIHFDDEIVILKEKYIVKSTISSPRISNHYIFLNDNDDLRSQIKILFKNKLLEYATNKTNYFFNMMKLESVCPKVIVKEVKTKWGCYFKRKNVIEYAYECMFLPEDVFDYIIIHELSHILQFNHSKNFYKVVEIYCPNYKMIVKKLKEC